ncbi:circadian clock KaiB family protein [Ramlibacter sp. XY19]|uniref:circadian clock KaiB family protein n=1 Tax=Ramlibacter paludis TaxID=2908000 RepID=UPI0023D9AD7F|nr:circadian clock KaiB family protein [Ramlibacter paludis]MCG2592313.1 circadian clock KaiB family protein [Ramlibacter paludis]
MSARKGEGGKRARGEAATCKLRLWVSAAAPLSARAVVNTRAFCETHLAGRYELEILSIADHVERASIDEVIAAPTLLRVWPLPVRRFIGDMSNPERLLDGLNLRREP